jgi:hypothetical protein
MTLKTNRTNFEFLYMFMNDRQNTSMIEIKHTNQRSKQAVRPACLPAWACLPETGAGHDFQAWHRTGRPGQGSLQARQAA